MMLRSSIYRNICLGVLGGAIYSYLYMLQDIYARLGHITLHFCIIDDSASIQVVGFTLTLKVAL